MKILELEYRGPPSIGGVETLVFEISKQFKSKGYEVEIWSTDLLDFNRERDKQLERVVDGISVRKFRSFKIPRFPFFIAEVLNIQSRDTTPWREKITFN